MTFPLYEATTALLAIGSPAMVLLGGFVKRGTSWANDVIQIGKKKVGLYSLFSYFFCIALVIYFALVGVETYAGQPLVLWDAIAGHYVSTVFLLAVILRFGYLDIIKGIYAAGFVYGLHEGMWFIADGIFTHNFDLVLRSYWAVVILCPALVLGYFIWWRSFTPRKELLILMMLLTLYTLWLGSGFDTSVNNILPHAKTVFFTDPNVNLTEVLGWVLTSLVALIG